MSGGGRASRPTGAGRARWRRRCGIAGACLALAFVQCRIPTAGPSGSLEPLWRDFQELPLRRALVLAGDPQRLWVAGMAGGLPSQARAVAVATEQCRAKRKQRRMREPCLVYAVDDEILWPR